MWDIFLIASQSAIHIHMLIIIIIAVHIEDLYCFHYTSSLEEIPRTAGWNFFDLETEFHRMGVPNAYWTLTNLNKDYQVS